MRHIYPMKDFFAEHHESRQIYLATVIQTEGTTFRKTGAKMLISANGAYCGIISGGCFENDVVERCLALSEDRSAEVVVYNLGSEEEIFFGTGTGCPGTVTVLIEKLDQRMIDQLKYLFTGIDTFNQQIVWNREITVNDQSQLLICHEFINEKDTKKYTFGPFSSEHEASVQIRNREVLEPVVPVLIYGKGDVVKALCQQLELIYIPHFVFVPQLGAELGRKFFPSAVEVHSYDALNYRFESTKELWSRSQVILVTHNYEFDLAAIQFAAHTPPRFLGVLGSASRKKLMTDKLSAEEKSNLSSIWHMPVGLPLGGRQPHDISLSIAAQLEQLRNVNCE